MNRAYVREYLYGDLNSYERLEEFLDLRHIIDNRVWWGLFGEIYSGADTHPGSANRIKTALACASKPQRHLAMRTAEKRKLSTLDAEVKVYRGCYACNEAGVSWSLNEKVASDFPLSPRYWREEQPYLLTGICERDTAILLLGRGEEEIVTDSVRVVSRRALFREVAA